MRKGFGISIIFILFATIGFVSAQGGLSELLNQIDESTLVLFAIFLIVFVLLFFSLKKVFRGDTTTPGIISVMLSLLITYGVNKTGFDVQGLISNLGISGEILSTILPIVIVAGIVFLIVYLAKNSLLAIGGLFILLSFFVYAKTLLIVVGVILIVLRFTVFLKKGRWEPKGNKDKGREVTFRY
jgi:membrane-associated HD superfamily phosphohydrolase